MNNRELLATTLLKEVLAGNATTIADDAWKLDNIDIGDGPKSYIIRNTKKLGTVSGKFFFKRNLFRVENDKEKLIDGAARYGKSPYGAHLKAVAEGKVKY